MTVYHNATTGSHGPFRKVAQTIEGISGGHRIRDEILECGHLGRRYFRHHMVDFMWDRLLTDPAIKRRCEQCRGEAAA